MFVWVWSNCDTHAVRVNCTTLQIWTFPEKLTKSIVYDSECSFVSSCVYIYKINIFYSTIKDMSKNVHIQLTTVSSYKLPMTWKHTCFVKLVQWNTYLTEAIKMTDGYMHWYEWTCWGGQTVKTLSYNLRIQLEIR